MNASKIIPIRRINSADVRTPKNSEVSYRYTRPDNTEWLKFSDWTEEQLWGSLQPLYIEKTETSWFVDLSWETIYWQTYVFTQTLAGSVDIRLPDNIAAHWANVYFFFLNMDGYDADVEDHLWGYIDTMLSEYTHYKFIPTSSASPKRQVLWYMESGSAGSLPVQRYNMDLVFLWNFRHSWWKTNKITRISTNYTVQISDYHIISTQWATISVTIPSPAWLDWRTIIVERTAWTVNLIWATIEWNPNLNGSSQESIILVADNNANMRRVVWRYSAYMWVKDTISTKSANYTLTQTDHTILVDAIAGDITITLPAVSWKSWQEYNIKKIDASSTSKVIITPAGAETIDGETSRTLLPAQWVSITLVTDWNNWFLI